MFLLDCTGGRCGVASHSSQPANGVDNKVLLQCKVGQTNALRAIDYKYDVQSSTALLTV